MVVDDLDIEHVTILPSEADAPLLIDADAVLARRSPHLSTRQYARIVRRWVGEIGLDPAAYGTHTLRRTKASLIYRRTKNLRAVQLLLGHSKLESTVR